MTEAEDMERQALIACTEEEPFYHENDSRDENGYRFTLREIHRGDHRRWSTYITHYIESNTGRWWRLRFDKGHTESQDDNFDQYKNPVEVTCTEEQVTKTVRTFKAAK